MLNTNTSDIEIGMGATLCHPNDMYPYTVIGIEHDRQGEIKYVVIQADEARSLKNFNSSNGLSYEDDRTFRYSRNPDGQVLILRWSIKRQQWQTSGGIRVAIGRRKFYQAREI